MSANGSYADWIAVDWGTSRLRAWAMRDNDPVAEASSDKGMGSLQRDGFEPALLDLVEPWLGAGTMPVFTCGMVGARQGWAEAPYRAVPCTPLGPGLAPVTVQDSRLSVRIVPGLKQEKPADVMRGEETQIAGVLAARPGFDGVICLPGTHTKWAHVSAGEVVSFQTFMTGEMFALLSGVSVLRHSVTGGEWDAAAFAEALSDGMSRPERLGARLFGLRAEHLLHAQEPGAARARLSGTLIGAELAASRPYWLGQQVIVVGEGTLAGLYVSALSAQGVEAQTLPVAGMTRAGLAAARALEEETTT